MGQGMSVEDLIRLRAYEIWMTEGEPEGREKEHWERARREIAFAISTPDREIGTAAPASAADTAAPPKPKRRAKGEAARASRSG